MSNLKTDWQALIGLIENKTPVFVTDKRGYSDQGIVSMADHRSMWIKEPSNNNQKRCMVK